MTTSLDSILSGTGAEPAAEGIAPEPQGLDAAPEANQGAEREPATVPIAVLQEERKKAKRYTEELADVRRALADNDTRWEQRFADLLGAVRAPQNAAPQAPDFFADPDAAVEQKIAAALAPMAAGQWQIVEQMSHEFALERHGRQAVQAAYSGLERLIASDPNAGLAEHRRIMSSRDPWGELVKWHRNDTALKEVGGDPASYRARIEAELIERLTGQPPQVLPTNLAGARNAGTRSGPAWRGPTSLNDIFDRTQKPRVA
jgi:hypothetical protein